MKEITAPAASFSNASLNSLLLIPDTSAKLFKESPPFVAARFILESKVENAVPPASASIPTLDNAPEKDMICASVILTCEPAPAIRIDMSTISDSVVARLFPSATTVEPSLSK